MNLPLGAARCLAAAWLVTLSTITQAASTEDAAAAPATPHAVTPALFDALSSGQDVDNAAPLRAALRALLAPGATEWDSECEADSQASGAPAGLIRTALADGSWLLQAVCAQGAYQGSFWAAHLWTESNAAAPSRAVAGEVAWSRAVAGQAALLKWPVVAEKATATSASASVSVSVSVSVSASASASASAAPVPVAAPVLEMTTQIVVWGDLESLSSDPTSGAAVELVNRFRALGDCGIRSRYALRHGTLRLEALAAAFVCPDTAPVGDALRWPRVAIPGR